MGVFALILALANGFVSSKDISCSGKIARYTAVDVDIFV